MRPAAASRARRARVVGEQHEAARDVVLGSGIAIHRGVAAHFGQRARAPREHRNAGRHRFQRGQPETFVQRRLRRELRAGDEAHEVCERQVLYQLDAIAEALRELERDAVDAAHAAMTCDQHQAMRDALADARERLQQSLRILVRLQEADEDDARRHGLRALRVEPGAIGAEMA